MGDQTLEDVFVFWSQHIINDFHRRRESSLNGSGILDLHHAEEISNIQNNSSLLMDSKIQEFRSDVQTLHSDVDTFHSDVDTFHSGVKILQNNITTLNTEIVDLKTLDFKKVKDLFMGTIE